MKTKLFLVGLLFTLSMSKVFAFDAFQSKNLIQQAVDLTQRHQFRAAYYKFSTVRVDIIDLHHSIQKTKLLNAIDVSIQKINDFGLSPQQKVLAVLDCAKVAYKQLQFLAGNHTTPLFPVSIQQTKGLMKQVLQAVSNYNERKALRLLKQVSISLEGSKFDQDIKKALKAVKLTKEKILDPTLSAFEKEELTRDCLNIFLKAINNFIAKTSTPTWGGGGSFGGGGCPSGF